jgi:hypothetical protein
MSGSPDRYSLHFLRANLLRQRMVEGSEIYPDRSDMQQQLPPEMQEQKVEPCSVGNRTISVAAKPLGSLELARSCELEQAVQKHFRECHPNSPQL